MLVCFHQLNWNKHREINVMCLPIAYTEPSNLNSVYGVLQVVFCHLGHVPTLAAPDINFGPEKCHNNILPLLLFGSVISNLLSTEIRFLHLIC